MTAGTIPSRTSVKPKTVRVGDRDVGARDEPAAAAERVAVDARHDGRGQRSIASHISKRRSASRRSPRS
jgi:hypothetical protein